MSKSIFSICLFLLVVAGPVFAQGDFMALMPVPFTNVRMEDEFWRPRIDVNHDVTVGHCLDWCESTGRISNFAKAAGLMDGKFEGIYFNDSDVYKVLEGAAHALALRDDPVLDRRVDAVIEKIAAAQDDYGYLNTYYTLVEPNQRWTNLRVRHELYCAGHLIEAGVAHYEAMGKRTLLDVAIRFADLIDSIFGPNKRHGVPGHEEIELALVKLHRMTGEERYLRLAEFFVEERGRPNGRELYGESLQDHLPIREQTEIVGHAVRAMYLYSAVADLAGINGDAGYFNAMDRIWNDLTGQKMYITGGIGVWDHHEGFSRGYDLPNEKAYAETCASIALALWAHRLNSLYADARYADLLERVLYNGILSGVSLDGDKFLYVNPLASHGPETFNTSGGKEGESKQHRQHWFRCACCPSNVVRFIPQVGGFAYAHDEKDIYVNLYVASHAEIPLSENRISIRQETAYPWDETIKLTIEPENTETFGVLLRIPGWCDNARLKVNGHKIDKPLMEHGYARIERQWSAGDAIELRLPMPVRRIQSHPNVLPNMGRIALQRGPLVYCLEGIDNGGRVMDISLPDNSRLRAKYKPNLLGGAVVIEGKGLRRIDRGDPDRLYRDAFYETEKQKVMAIPYCLWDNRKPGEMVVWIPRHPSLSETEIEENP